MSRQMGTKFANCNINGRMSTWILSQTRSIVVPVNNKTPVRRYLNSKIKLSKNKATVAREYIRGNKIN
jgi:hypothetical protein